MHNIVKEDQASPVRAAPCHSQQSHSTLAVLFGNVAMPCSEAGLLNGECLIASGTMAEEACFLLRYCLRNSLLGYSDVQG